METLSSIGIAKWAGSQSVEPLYSTGSGDAKVTTWRRADGALALETNGDPVFGSIAEAWDAGYNDGIAGKPAESKGEAYEAGYTAGEAVYIAEVTGNYPQA